MDADLYVIKRKSASRGVCYISKKAPDSKLGYWWTAEVDREKKWTIQNHMNGECNKQWEKMGEKTEIV